MLRDWRLFVFHSLARLIMRLALALAESGYRLSGLAIHIDARKWG